MILQDIDARDLANRGWCDRSENCYFRRARSDAIRVLADMSRALQHLGERKVIHNDIKPANILYSHRTGAILIDFGLATDEKKEVSIGGTPWYVAPEYLNSRQRNAPADVWATGVVMLYLLKLVCLPDSQKQAPSWIIKDVAQLASAAAAMRHWLKIVNSARKLLVDKKDQDWLAKVVWRMLEPDPSKRISAAELALELEHR